MPDSKHYQCLVATQTKIRSLNLIDSNSVRIRLLPIDRDFGNGTDTQYGFPAIILSPLGQEVIQPATNLRDDVAFPVTVSFVDSSDLTIQEMEQNINDWLSMRDTIVKAFSQQRLPNVSGVWKCDVEAQQIISPENFGRSRRVGFLTLKFVSREERGS